MLHALHVRRGRPAWTCLALLTAVMATSLAPGAVSAGGFETTELNAEPSIAGLGPRWKLPISVTNSDGAALLTVQRKNAAGTVRAGFSTRVADVDLTCAPKLGTCSVSDGDAMGTYGNLELAFTATGPRRTTEIHCQDSDDIKAIVYKRAGVLSGTFRLDVKNATIGVIRDGAGAHRIPATFAATVTRRVTTGVDCGTPAPPCAEEVALATDANLDASRRLPNGKARFQWNQVRASAEPGVVRYQWIRWTAPAPAFSVNTAATLGSATIDLAGGAPYLTGGGLHAATEPIDDTYILYCDDATARDGETLIHMTVDLPWAPASTFQDQVDSTLIHVID